MYLTAHLVRSPSDQEGINSFLNLHGDQQIPLRGPGEPDIDFVSQFAGGYASAMKQEVEAGGNSVRAYLDVVAEDGVTAERIGHAIEAVKSRLGTESLPVTGAVDGVGIRFGADLSFEGSPQSLAAVLDRLSDAAAALLARRSDRQLPVVGPYVVWIFYGPDGIQLTLPPMTLRRLPQSVLRRARLLIPPDLLHAGTTFDILRECATGLLGVGEDELQAAGGVEIVDPRTGKTMARYAPGVA
jgi:hypothetical protein